MPVWWWQEVTSMSACRRWKSRSEARAVRSADTAANRLNTPAHSRSSCAAASDAISGTVAPANARSAPGRHSVVGQRGAQHRLAVRGRCTESAGGLGQLGLVLVLLGGEVCLPP